MIGTASAVVICAAVTAWGAYLVIRSQRAEYRQRCRARRYDSTVQHGQRTAMERAANGRVCACCKGVLTALRWDNETQVNVCADRDLCRETMIHEHMLASVE